MLVRIQEHSWDGDGSMPVPDVVHARWHKSSRSSGGASNCVEIATGTVWQKSSRSSGGANNCVEIAVGTRGRVWAAVRDSKDPDGGMLLVSAPAFRAFVDAAGAGVLD